MSDEIARITRKAGEDDSDAVQHAADEDLDIEAPEADSAEQHTELLQHHDDPGDEDLDIEAPEADSADQHTELLQHHDDPATGGPSDRDGEADPADIAEQRRVVALDEDDYR